MQRFFLLSGLLFLLAVSNVNAATVTARSCSQSDVQSAIQSAINGDTVSIPAGSCTWSSYVTVNKQITVKGAGVGSTIVNGKGFTFPNGTDNWRLTGIEFRGNSNDIIINVGNYDKQVHGCWNFRIDNNKFTGGYNWMQLMSGNTGVIDHNTFYDVYGGTGVRFASGADDAAWMADTNLGTSDFVFLENNSFYKTSDRGTGFKHVIMGQSGARYVFRFNHIEDSAVSGGYIPDPIDVHGFGHDRNGTGGRAYEIYNNTFTRHNSNSCCRGMQIRGGTGVIFNNKFNYKGARFNNDINLNDYRASVADGMQSSFSRLDSCSTAQYCPTGRGGEGYPCCDQIGRGKSLGGHNQMKEPLYIWDNFDQNGNPLTVTVNSSSAAYIQKDRDFIMSAKPGYVPYAYPHPLISGGMPSTAGKPNPPTSLRVE